MKQYSVILIGAGLRGTVYTNEMHKLGDKLDFDVSKRNNTKFNLNAVGNHLCVIPWKFIFAFRTPEDGCPYGM